MTTLISLQCPTCGASLQVDQDSTKCSCGHCGNAYLLEQKAREIDAAQRGRILPLATYTHQLRQWLRVGEHEIFVHGILDEIFEKERLISVDAEYRNNSMEILSCRRNQWVLYDSDAYSYDTMSNTTVLEQHTRPPIGGERIISPGGRVRGWVAFKVPESAKPERLQFLTGFLKTKTVDFLFKS